MVCPVLEEAILKVAGVKLLVATALLVMRVRYIVVVDLRCEMW